MATIPFRHNRQKASHRTSDRFREKISVAACAHRHPHVEIGKNAHRSDRFKDTVGFSCRVWMGHFGRKCFSFFRYLCAHWVCSTHKKNACQPKRTNTDAHDTHQHTYTRLIYVFGAQCRLLDPWPSVVLEMRGAGHRLRRDQPWASPVVFAMLAPWTASMLWTV